MIGATLQTAERALGFVSPDDRDVWVRMGMALKAEYGDAAYGAWESWSSVAKSFDVKACKATWKSFKNGGGVGIGSLFSEAKDEGFHFEKEEMEVSPEELARRQREREEREAKAEKDRLARADAAANRAASQWRTAALTGVSPYLERKQVRPESCRYLAEGTILIPMLRYDHDPVRIVGKQQIAADGTKKYSSGMDKAGAMCRLGTIPNDGDDIYVGEGYATCGSIRAALAYAAPVYVCFDTSGLMHGAKLLRKIYPSSRIIFCADDDYLTGNKGLEKAQAAADQVGNALVGLPHFNVIRRASKDDESLPMLTDFNDLHVAQSLGAVEEQLHILLEAAKTKPVAPVLSLVKNSPVPPVDESTPVFDENGAPIPASGGGGKKKKPKKEYGQGHFDTVDYLKNNFVLIYGDDTAWDSVNRVIIKINHMRLAFTSDAVKWWLNSPDRKMVNKEDVVFDPTMQADPYRTVNMFHGFEMEPKEGKCDKIIELLLHLCNGNAEVMAWVLRWIAYPLQHKGAKMRTSVIIHGDEGSGKNLFWENVVARIYGEYGGVIGNAQIESQFNEWASKKLFFVADEVVTRNELRQLKGKLKHMVTGEVIMINPKGMTERAEANHMNFVFLSNELQPLALDKTDRRYLVIWTPPKKDEAFYKQVSDQVNHGGVEAFYHYLMHKVPLADFTEHTKPIETDAKVKLVGLGLSPPERFYREWSGGFLPLPFVCCSAHQLYQAFCRWCHLNGERFPMTQTMFGRSIERVGLGDGVRRAVIKYDLGKDVKQRTAYLVGEMPADKTRTTWVEDASALFEESLKKYRHVYDQPNELSA